MAKKAKSRPLSVGEQVNGIEKELVKLGEMTNFPERQSVKNRLLAVLNQWGTRLAFLFAFSIAALLSYGADTVPLQIPKVDAGLIIAMLTGAWELVVRLVPTAGDYSIVSRVLGLLGNIFPNRVKGKAGQQWVAGDIWTKLRP